MAILYFYEVSLNQLTDYVNSSNKCPTKLHHHISGCGRLMIGGFFLEWLKRKTKKEGSDLFLQKSAVFTFTLNIIWLLAQTHQSPAQTLHPPDTDLHGTLWWAPRLPMGPLDSCEWTDLLYSSTSYSMGGRYKPVL